MKQYVTMTTDVLVIGAGAAGIRAALAASEQGAQVVNISRGYIADSGSTFSKISKGWGIQALVRAERTDEGLQAFYDDIIQAGLGQCDPRLVQILVEESGERVEDLISYGIQLRKDHQGDYLRVKGCFSDSERAFLTSDFENVRQTFRSIQERSSAKILKGYVLDLIISEHACWGAWVITDAEELIRLNAKATILATGGGAGVYRDHLVSDNDVGVGYALAHRAGAELNNMEFIQFMLGLKNNGKRRFLPISGLQKPGVLNDSTGRDLMEVYLADDQSKSRAIDDRQKHFPFSCRDFSCQIDIAVAQARKEGNKAYWNDNGSPVQDTEVVHFAHAFNGGVKIDEKAETTVAGLYAAGEVASGPHGADRIGGCMMTATQVFGERAGKFAAKRARQMNGTPFPDIDLSNMFVPYHHEKTKNDTKIIEIKNNVKELMGHFAVVLRDEEGLILCLRGLEECERKLFELRRVNRITLKDFVNTSNMIFTASLVANSSLKRRESRGSHYRGDFSSIAETQPKFAEISQ